MRKHAGWLWLWLAAPLAQAACPPLLDYRVPRLTGGSTDLCQYQDKTIVVVNTASECGFTPQFAQLQTLWQQYRSRGVVVLGFPSDDFFQELEQAKDIAEFCQSNYGVDFPMMSRISVRGSNAHPFYQALASAAGSTPKWNFYKYIIAPGGKSVIAFGPLTRPDDPAFLKALQQRLPAAP